MFINRGTNRKVVVATEEEYRQAKKRFSDFEIIKTGVGAVNVIRTLKDLNKNTPLLNFGYAGSNVLKPGEEIEIGKVALSRDSRNCKKLHIQRRWL
jgi:hypothetical protein